MEFGVAAFGSAVGAIVAKLLVISTRKVASADANNIRIELLTIKGVTGNPSNGRYIRLLGADWMAELRRLACDIEDCIDSFNAEKTKLRAFEKEMATLKVRSRETRELLAWHMKMERPGDNGESASSTQVQRDPPCGDLPKKVNDNLLSDKKLKNWFDVNLNCLLYLFLFPRDHHVRSKPLIRRWQAEGLVQVEEEAVQNLKILVNLSAIGCTQKGNNGAVKRCQPTDEMAQYISQRSVSENFILFCDDQARLKAAEYPRRLSVHLNGAANGVLDLPPDLSHLRTLAVFGAHATSLASYGAVLNFAKMYGVLRVLDLKECAHLGTKHLSDICDQVLMKYLSIGGHIDRITRKIGDLKQLETLDVSGSGIVTVYIEVLLLPRLKHLLGKFQLSRSDTLWKHVPSKVEKFLKEKSELETIAGFVTSGRKGFPQLMTLVRMLRKVKIWCKSNASKQNLRDISTAITKFIKDGQKKPAGRSLSIEFEGPGQLLDNLQAVGGVASLKLRGPLTEFPEFVTHLDGIEELCLASTNLVWISQIVDKLNKLKILKYLKLVEDNLGPVVVKPTDLRSVARLCLVCVPRLEITIEADALPNLESLHMLCADLDVVPGTPGIEITHMGRLSEVALHSSVDGSNIGNTWQEAARVHSDTLRVVYVSP